MAAITLPTYMPFERWAAQLVVDLPDYTVPTHPDLKSWWNWAASLGETLDIGTFPIPSKLIYPDEDSWRQWATDFIAGLQIRT